MGLDVINSLLHRGDLLGVFVGNLGFELFLERHHQFYRVQRVGAEIIDERGIIGDFCFLDA